MRLLAEKRDSNNIAVKTRHVFNLFDLFFINILNIIFECVKKFAFWEKFSSKNPKVEKL